MRQRTALVQDNDPQVLSLEAQIIEELGYTVIKCATGEFAYHALNDEDQEFDLVVCDLDNTYGTGLTDHARRRNDKTGIILVAASGPIGEHSADMYTRKPFDVEVFESLVRSFEHFA